VSARITITAVGDMMFDRRLLPPRMFYHYPEVSACVPGFEGHSRIPFVNMPDSQQWLTALERPVHGIQLSSHAATSERLALPAEADDPGYPFSAIADDLRADIIFGNLECPLSDRGRRLNNDTCYRASPRFAEALARVGFRVVSFANNHAFDYGEVAFHDTLEALRTNGIAVVGAGASLGEARRPAILEVEGVKIAFLAYSMVGPDWIYAGPHECGVVPLNPLIVGQDIAAIRSKVDIVLLSVHWGVEGRSTPWPRLTEMARDFIDCGADAILGHHTHVPGSIDVYHGRPIFYSLGNFTFGHDHDNWGEDMIVRLGIENRQLRDVEVSPIRGRYQPGVLNGNDARQFHDRLMHISRGFKIGAAFQDGKSRIELSA
jgi:poly-gamma-glutamate capsule biosynthesis protein CapA/YwtB (metallophosphatase superfamily)